MPPNTRNGLSKTGRRSHGLMRPKKVEYAAMANNGVGVRMFQILREQDVTGTVRL